MNSKSKPGKYTVYILRTSADTLYVGQTNNLKKRLIKHQSKKGGAKYLSYYTTFQLVYRENYSTRSEAMKRECEIKKWSKSAKEAFLLNQKL